MTFYRKSGLLAEILQGIPRDPVDGPFIHGDRAKASIELDGGRIPIQNPPLKTAIPFFFADSC